MHTISDIEKIQREFGVYTLLNKEMEQALRAWESVRVGRPLWLNKTEETTNFGRTIGKEIARLSLQDAEITATGSARAKYINALLQQQKNQVRQALEDGACLGMMVAKPSLNGTDYVMPTEILITEINSIGEIVGAIFFDYSRVGKKYYTRLEYHRFNDDIYRVSSRAYVSERAGELGKKCPLGSVASWADIQPEIGIRNIERPLFAVFKMPAANPYSRAYGFSCYGDALKQLEDLDTSYSMMIREIEDSGKITFVPTGAFPENAKRPYKPPRFVLEAEFGFEDHTTFHEHNPALQTPVRLTGKQSIIEDISFLCGFSKGYFTGEKTANAMTATQAEMIDKRVTEMIEDVRGALKLFYEQLIYAYSKYADLYNLAPSGEVQVQYYFKDLQTTFEQDRARAYQLVLQGIIPKWHYLAEYEGYSEQEAKRMVQEAEDIRQGFSFET